MADRPLRTARSAKPLPLKALTPRYHTVHEPQIAVM